VRNIGIGKCVKTIVSKKIKIRNIKLKIIQTVLFVFNVLVFNNCFCSVGLQHMFISKILLVMGVH